MRKIQDGQRGLDLLTKQKAKFRHAQPDHQGKIPDKFLKNLTSGFGEHVKMMLYQCLKRRKS